MTDLFQEPGTNPVQEPDDKVNALATQLFSIKNEDGNPKYDSLEKALGALAASQQFIPQLKDENKRLADELAALKAEASTRESVEDVIARLTQRQPEAPTPTSEVPKGLDEAAVQALLQRTLSERDTATAAQQNVGTVTSALTSKFGDKAREVLAAKAAELGMTLKQVQDLSATAPQAVLSWFQASTHQSTASPLRSTVGLPPVQQDKLTSPAKSLMRGASGNDLKEFMARVRQEVYRENDIQE